jgi:glycosyltransferase involved in cell wall biosynthesis
MRIVDKRFNTGLADARNVGIELARAPFIFMMDADNLIFPNALRELLDAISRENCAAAYSLLCRFRGTPANRVGLLSHYDWDPQILVQHPYIDAMAMFRRDALLQLGGYDNQLSRIGWFGWEDYDMWLRFAQRNYRVGFVPNILCLYRHHQTSMLNVTNLFELDLVWHFKQRFEDLINCFEPRATLFGVDREKIVQAERASAGSPSLPQISVPARK